MRPIDAIHLRVLLPYRVFADVTQVREVTIQTPAGTYGLLPHRLDCVAALSAGILSYRTDATTTKYIAVDGGIAIKAGSEVTVSVRKAIGGEDLSELSALVAADADHQNQRDREEIHLVARLEKAFVFGFDKFRNA